jgi:hypothetical protein
MFFLFKNDHGKLWLINTEKRNPGKKHKASKSKSILNLNSSEHG